MLARWAEDEVQDVLEEWKGRPEWVGSVVRVMRASERLMAVELALEGELVTFVSVYASHRKRRTSFMMSYTGLSVS